AEDTLTITTYYPSPYGVYRELRAKRIAIGDDYIDGANYTWQETESGSGEVDFNADLVVEGNVGIGTVNPVVKLDVVNISSAGLLGSLRLLGRPSADNQEVSRINFATYNASPTNNIVAYIRSFRTYDSDDGILRFGTGNTADPTDRMTIDENGNVGIGTTSPGGRLHVHQDSTNANLVVTGNFAPELRIASSASDLSTSVTFGMATGAGHYLGNAASGDAIVLSRPGNILFGTDNSTERMRICGTTGNVGIGTTAPGTLLQIGGGTGSLHVITPGLLIKNTTAYERSMMEIHAPSGANRLVIQTLADTSFIASLDAKPLALQTSGGNVGIGTGAPGAVLEVDGTGVLQTLYHSGGSTSGVYTYYSVSGGGAIGSVTYNGSWSGILFNTSSDRRLKENIIPTSRGLKELMSIPVRDFNFIADPGKKKIQGFIAQELYKAYPEAVTVGGNNPKTEPWMVDYARLTPLLVKSVQELKGENDSIKLELCRKGPDYSWCK
ncbi:MAG: tail fiber domain-containing protein, partial [Candidatus Omnitrophota bacterium]